MKQDVDKMETTDAKLRVSLINEIRDLQLKLINKASNAEVIIETALIVYLEFLQNKIDEIEDIQAFRESLIKEYEGEK